MLFNYTTKLPRWAVTLVVLISLIAGCSKSPGPSAGGARGAGPGLPISVYAAPVTSVPWSDRISAIGTTAANESITLTAKVTENVARVNFEDGDVVEAGAILVELSGRAEVAALREAQSAYSDAERQYKRLADVVTQGTVTRAALDTQGATRDQARARSEAIRARLSDRVITAPFAGVLGFRTVSPGTLVTPGTAIATLDDIETLKLDFSLPETSLGALKLGDPITGRSAAFPDRTFPGTVRSLDSRVDPLTRALTVRARIDNSARALKPGMLLVVELATGSRQALAVPEISVLQLGDEAYVFKVGAKQTAERTVVQVGARRGGLVEIRGGLSEGDLVVGEGNVKLRPGLPIKVLEAQAPSSEPSTN